MESVCQISYFKKSVKQQQQRHTQKNVRANEAHDSFAAAPRFSSNLVLCALRAPLVPVHIIPMTHPKLSEQHLASCSLDKFRRG